MGNQTLQQERDMRQMRTDHETEIMRLMFEAADAGPGELAPVISRMRSSITPLMDAAYGPVRDASMVTAIKFPKPRCIQCGGHVTSIGPFCEECEDALGEPCEVCGGHGFYAVDTYGSGENAVEVPCEGCK